MKLDIHPSNYQLVIFHDNASGEEFLIASTIETSETGMYDGKEYPLARIEISSASHPFYTGAEKRVDTAGRAERFRAKVEAAKKAQEKNKKNS